MAGLSHKEELELLELEEAEYQAKKAKAVAPVVDKPSPIATSTSATPASAAVEGAGDTLTLGYAPQIKGGISRAVEAVTGIPGQKVLATIDSPISDVVSGKAYENLPEAQSYVELRDLANKRSNALKEEYPKSYLGGQIAGAFVPGVGLGGSGTKALATLGESGLKAALPAIAKTAGQAGLSAALYNPGDVEGEISPLQLPERAEAGAVGLATGAALGGLQQAAPAVISAAENLATRSIGRGTQAMKRVIGDSGLKDVGKKALESGVVSWIPKTVKQIEKKVEALREGIGKAIGGVIDKADDAERQLAAEGAQVGISKSAIRSRVEQELLSPENFPDPDYVKKVGGRLDNLQAIGGESDLISTKGAHTIKTRLGQQMEKKGIWKRAKMGMQSPDDLIDLTLYDALGDSVIDSTTGLSSYLGKGAQNEITKLNGDYKILKNMQKLAQDQVARSNTNNLILGAAPLVVGGASYAGNQDPVQALALTAGLAAGRRMVPQMASKGLFELGKALPKIGGSVAGKLTGEAMQDDKSRAKDLVENYDSRQDFVSIPAEDLPLVKEKINKSKLTNTEKAKILVRLNKEGDVSKEVGMRIMGIDTNPDAQNILQSGVGGN